MNGARTLEEMGEFYAKSIIEEKKSPFSPKDSFKVVTDKVPAEAEAKKDAFVDQKNTGPENAEGVNTVIDTKATKQTKKENHYEPEKFSQKCEKVEAGAINTFMSKSIFDKLYEDVMSDQLHDKEANDAEALGLPSVDAGKEEEGGAGEEVTLSLPRELAQKLCDALHEVLESETEETSEHEGETEGSSDEAGMGVSPEESNEEKEEEDKEEVAKEATELKELPASSGQSLQKKDNKVGDVTKSLTSSGPGDAKVTDKVGNDGEKGHALVGGGVKGGASTSPKGKANVVNSKTSKVGAYLAGLK